MENGPCQQIFALCTQQSLFYLYSCIVSTVKQLFLSRILDLDPNKAIGIEISYLSITSIEVLKKDNIRNKGGKYRLLSVNNQFI